MKRKYLSFKTNRHLIEDNIESLPQGNYTNLQYKLRNKKNSTNKILNLAVDTYSSYNSLVLMFIKSLDAKELTFSISEKMKFFYVKKLKGSIYQYEDMPVKYLDRLILIVRY